MPEKNIKLQRRVEAADGDTWNAPEVPVEWMCKLYNILHYSSVQIAVTPHAIDNPAVATAESSNYIK